MRRSLVFGVIASCGLLAGAAFWTVAPAKISKDAIQSSVTRTPELVDKAWKLPVAAAYGAGKIAGADRRGPRTRPVLQFDEGDIRP